MSASDRPASEPGAWGTAYFDRSTNRGGGDDSKASKNAAPARRERSERHHARAAHFLLPCLFVEDAVVVGELPPVDDEAEVLGRAGQEVVVVRRGADILEPGKHRLARVLAVLRGAQHDGERPVDEDGLPGARLEVGGPSDEVCRFVVMRLRVLGQRDQPLLRIDRRAAGVGQALHAKPRDAFSGTGENIGTRLGIELLEHRGQQADVFGGCLLRRVVTLIGHGRHAHTAGRSSARWRNHLTQLSCRLLNPGSRQQTGTERAPDRAQRR